MEKLTQIERQDLAGDDIGRKALRILDARADLILELAEHLDYCGWGDRWERECSESLRERARVAVEALRGA